ncbi:MAG: GH32 C-terminal domain-containing protein [candidate division KSB1 bacterium]|nr:GH32 C-terminal domain-containing protein [candidate division KSB1 bacterium]
MPFNQMMTFPTQLSLRTTHQGIRLFSEPVREIEKLHVKKYQWQNLKIKGKAFQLPQPVNDELLHIKAEFEIQLARRFGIRVHGYTVKYDLKDNLLNGEFVSPVDHKIYLEILLDRNSIEIFANHGRFYLAEAYNSVDQPKHIELFSRNGVTLLKNLEIYPLKSIWNQK